MWISTKRRDEGEYEFLRPNCVEKIEYAGDGYDGPTFRFYIDGKTYTSGCKLPCYVGWGSTVITEEIREGKSYNCDDSVIIAAVARFIFTHECGDMKRVPSMKRGDLLPLLPRKTSREYLQWHKIPHPGKCLHLSKKYKKYRDFQPSTEEFIEDLKNALITNPFGVEEFLEIASAFKSCKINSLTYEDVLAFMKTISMLDVHKRDEAVDVFCKCVEGESPLRSAIVSGEKEGHSLLLQFDTEEMLDFLLQNGANPNAIVRDSYPEPNMPVLAVLAYGMEISKMRFLLEHGADPNQGIDGGVRPLDMALFMKRGYESAKLLLEYGADAKLCKDQKTTMKALKEYEKVCHEWV